MIRLPPQKSQQNEYAMRTLRFVLVLIAVSYPQCSLATLIVGRRTSTEVVVGADSLQVSTVSGKADSVCKIVQAGRIFAATAGHSGFSLSDNDRIELFGGRVPILARDGGSSLRNFIVATVTNPETVLHAAGLLVGRLLEPLGELLTWNMMRNRRYYVENLLNKTFTNLVLFGWENDSPVLVLVDFRAVGEMDKPPKVEPNIRMADAVAAGWSRDVLHLIRDSTFWKGNPAKEIEKVIELQIQAAPDKVQAPIDILQLDKTGPKWIKRKQPECPDVTLPR